MLIAAALAGFVAFVLLMFVFRELVQIRELLDFLAEEISGDDANVA